MAASTVTELFDFDKPVQMTAVVGGLRSIQVEPFTAPWAEVFELRTAKAKAKAPAVIPATFGAEDLVKTKSGRPAKNQAESCTALFIDFDDGKDDLEDIEGALMALGLAGTVWSTWKSTVAHPRWRIAVPLAHPVLPSAQEKVWYAVARALQSHLKGSPDWAARHSTQLAILPCMPAQEDMQAAGAHKTDPWGWMTPNPIHVDGRPVVPEEVERAESSLHYGRKLSFVQARREGKGRGERKIIAPLCYEGSPDAPGAVETVAAWRADRTLTVSLTAGLDAVERVRREGLGSRPGGRGSVISAGCFHMYRCGFPIAAITTWGQDALARTGGRDPAANLTRDLSEQVRDFAKRAAEPKASAWAVAAHGVLRDTPGLQECQADALARFIIVLARSKHLMREGGGQLSFADISILLGMPTTNVVSWRLTLESSGLLDRWGSDRSTHYALNIKEVVNG